MSFTEKQKFYYLFDWGEEWWHKLTLEGESSTQGKKLPDQKLEFLPLYSIASLRNKDHTVL